MYKYGLQCALEELPSRMPAILRGSIDFIAKTASKTGYDAIELYIRNPGILDVPHLKAVAEDNGLKYCCICTGLEFILNRFSLTADSVEQRRAAIDRLKDHMDLGANIGASVVIGSMRGSLPDEASREEYLDRLAAALTELNSYASQIGAQLLIENIHQYISNYLCTVSEVGEFIYKLSLPYLKLHIDTHSMHMEEKSPFDIVRKYGDIIGYVHFSDSNRGYPGAGAIDFKAYCHALMDIGYNGYITAECQPYPSQEVCAMRALTYMKAIENAAIIERSPVSGEYNK